MMTKYLIYTGIFLLLGACSNKLLTEEKYLF